MKEQRLYKRHTAMLPARIEVIMTSGKKKICDLETKDISIGGAFIYTKESSFFQEGTRFIIDFTIPSGSNKYLAGVISLIDGEGSMLRSTPEGIAIHFDREF